MVGNRKYDSFIELRNLQVSKYAYDSYLMVIWEYSFYLKLIGYYSYNPDLISDSFSEDGTLWSFNYFFYNSKLKRVVFFTYRALQ